jgi:hypothetical protein
VAKRLGLFIKGNVDVHDSLHSCRVGGRLLWNGINDILRQSHPGITARIRHETWTRSDSLVSCTGEVPEAVSERDLPLGVYPAASQFSRAVFETPADAVILSLLPDIATGLVRHKQEGFLFYAADFSSWAPEDRGWLKSDFTPTGFLDFETSMANLEAIVNEIRKHKDVPILIYNVSPIIPGERIHCYQGLDETFANRIRRFNLGLVGLSERAGISIVDVDTLIACHGADTMKLDAFHLTPQAYRLVAEEVVRILDDLGVLEDLHEGRQP